MTTGRPSGIRAVTTMGELAQALRWLRRGLARAGHTRELTYREIAARTGWSHTTVAGYFSGKILAPTDRFDELVRLLGALPGEQSLLATARDRVEEQRRTPTAPAAAGEPTSGAKPVRQLPAPHRHFAARAGEIAILDGLLQGSPSGPAIAVIWGTAGVGKTALAVHWAHRRAEAFPDGQLYLDLHGFAATRQPMPAAHAVAALLSALLPPGERLPALPDAQLGLYRSLLADSRLLLVVDNARHVGQVRPLLPPSSHSAVVVTSRNQLISLVAVEGARPVGLGMLDRDEAYSMLAQRLGSERLRHEEAAVASIITDAAGLPLALSVAAARAESRCGFALATIAAELRHAWTPLDPYADPDPAADLRSVLSWSYQALGADAARLFRLLAVHPGPDVTLEAAASLLGADRGTATSALRALTRASLLDEYAPTRFVLHHPLLGAYAGGLTLQRDDEAERAAAVRRVLDHYRHMAFGGPVVLHANRTPIAPQAPAGTHRITSAATERLGDGLATALGDGVRDLSPANAQQIAHDADRAAAMEAGRMVELGSHKVG